MWTGVERHKNEQKADLVLVSEPNRTLAKKYEWYLDEDGDACIIRVNKSLKVTAWGRGRGFAWVQLTETCVYACYISPNAPMTRYEKFLQDLETDVRKKGGGVLIGGDFNAKSPAWGSPIEDERGEALVEWALVNGLMFLNKGDTPTFQRGASTSHLDITMASEGVGIKIDNWTVSEEETFSLHRLISFTLRGRNCTNRSQRGGPGVLRIREARRLIRGSNVLNNENTQLGDVIAELQAFMRSIYVPTRTSATGNSVYWWTPELADEKASLNVARRALTRSRVRGHASAEDLEGMENEYRRLKNAYKKSVLRAKQACWRKLIDDLEDDIWGEGFSIMKRSLNIKTPKVDLTPDKRTEIARTLFPMKGVEAWENIMCDNTMRITTAEVKEAARRLKERKAPGPDGIPAELIKVLVDEKGEVIRKLLDDSFRRGEFPARWKESKLVLIPKPGKETSSPSAFRPICLIDTLAKLYEGIILHKLKNEIERCGGLHPRQHGFRQGRSTIDALKEVTEAIKATNQNNRWCALILFDVKNAFNTADWGLILRTLVNKGIDGHLTNLIAAYLSQRRVLVSRNKSLETFMGVPQGSILGPTLWNTLYDSVLEVYRGEEEVILVAYADDLAAVVTGESKGEVIENGNRVMELVDEWMSQHSLELAPEKMEAVFVTGMRRTGNLRFNFRGKDIAPKKEVKYLGMVIDSGMTFGAHVQKVCNKAEKTAAALAKLMPNVGGPGQKKRAVMAGVIDSVILYAANIWSGAMRINRHRERVLRAQRKLSLRIAHAYRTISTIAANVIAGRIPMDLRVEERGEIATLVENGVEAKEAKRRARENAYAKWQARWQNSNRAAWTRRLIPDVKIWVERRHGEATYQITQALTGHGNFGEYLKRIGKWDHDRCPYCEEMDSAEHTLFLCEKWEAKRRHMTEQVGEEIAPNNMVLLSTRSKQDWKAIMGTWEQIMTRKEQDMRRNEGQ